MARNGGIVTRIGRWAKRGALGLLAAVALYIVAGLIGSLLPANPRAAPPADAITIHISDNGIHTGLILPTRHDLADWSDLVRPEDLPDPRNASEHLLFGWGDRVFYVETPTWWDLRPGTALAALFGSEGALLHIDHVAAPRPGDSIRPIVVSPAQYRAIAARIRRYFILGADGRPTPVRGYGATDVFYEATGRYSAFDTCNEWTGSVLREAGVRVGRWTPFSFGLMWWFPRED
ncbi:MAG: TIGR02117 family protein [Sphingomonadaceae bacterium]|nr:TIGR02117 family protein [Sphingomonadaceae bacterium]